MFWIVAIVVCIILLYALSETGPRKRLIPLLVRSRGAQEVDLPADLWARRYYVVGYVPRLTTDDLATLGDAVCVRDIDKLVEDAVVLMAPIRTTGMLTEMRKWEIVADLAREASPKPILFTGRLTEIFEGVTLGLTGMPCLHDLRSATQSADNLNWRIHRRYKYRDRGYKSSDIPAVIWLRGPDPTVLLSRLKKRLLLIEATNTTSAANLRSLIDDTDLNVVIWRADGALAAQREREYWGLYDYIFDANVTCDALKAKLKDVRKA